MDWKSREEDPAGLDVKRVGGSGSGVIKGDQIGPDWMVEIKSTAAYSYRVQYETIRKMKEQAARQGKAPVLRVDLVRAGEMVAVLPWDMFILLVEACCG